jgi:hypothetical protein
MRPMEPIATSCQLSVVSCQLSVVSCQLIRFRFNVGFSLSG